MKFLIDMPLSPRLVAWLEERGHNAAHALEMGLGQAEDSTILRRARDEDRVILTADLDYPRLLAHSSECGPGLILFRGGCYSEAQIRERLDSVLCPFKLMNCGIRSL